MAAAMAAAKMSGAGASEEPEKPPANCFVWFFQDPLNRLPFAVFLFFGACNIIWIMMYVSSFQYLAYLMAGIIAVIMGLYGASQFRSTLNLRATVDELDKNNDVFDKKNEQLRAERRRLLGVEKILKREEAELKENVKRMANQLSQFRKLNGDLKRLGATSVQGLETLVNTSQKIMDQWVSSLARNEKAMLNDVFDEFEMKDGHADLTEDEFNGFLAALPPKYTEALKNMGKSFEDYAGADGVIDYSEFTQLADDLAEEVAKTGGSFQPWNRPKKK